MQSFSCDQPKASGKCTFHKHFARFRAPLEAKAGTGINAKSKVVWKTICLGCKTNNGIKVNRNVNV